MQSAAGWPPGGKRLARLMALVVLSLSCCLGCLCLLLPLLGESSFADSPIDSLAAVANGSSQPGENPIKVHSNDNDKYKKQQQQQQAGLEKRPPSQPPSWLLFDSSAGASLLLQDEEANTDDAKEQQQQQQQQPQSQEVQSFKRPSLPSNPSQQQRRENSENPKDENWDANQATNKQVVQPTPPPLSRNRRLALDRRPILNEFSFPANLMQGMRYVLMCQVLDGDLPIQIKWFKDGQELDSMALQQQQQQRDESPLQIEMLSNDELGSSLLFRRVQQKHSGNYTCLASNHLGSSSFSSSLSVKIAPKWRLEPPDQVESIIGQQMSIDCQAEGNPNPFIRWKFSQANNLQQQQQHQNGHLTSAGRSSGAASQELAPLAAAAAALAPASQTQTFKLINSNHHVQTLENGSLAIRQTSKEDEGLYLCEADNGLEPSLVKVVRLIVHLQAQIVDEIQLLNSGQQQPSIEAGAQISSAAAAAAATATSSSGGGGGGISAVIRSVRLAAAAANSSSSSSPSVRLLCRPLGELPLTVDWLKDEQPVYTQTITSSHSAAFVAAPAGQYGQSGDEQLSSGGGGGGGGTGARLHVSTRPSPQAAPATAGRPLALPLPLFESELQLTGLRRSDAGLFTCVARNAFGRSERRLKLVLQEPPEPPEVVDVAHIGSRTVGLRWLMPQFDGHSPILKFVVEFAKLGPQQAAAATNQISANSAADQFNAGSWTANQLDWRQLAATGSETSAVLLLGHSERLMPQQQQQQLQSAKQADQQQQQPVQHTVHELEPLTRYSMRVIAVNAVGRSRPSAALTLRTEEEVPSVVPSSVGALVLGSRSVKLHWTLVYSPEREIIDGFFIGYRSFDAASPLLDGAKLSAAAASAASSGDSSSAQAASPGPAQSAAAIAGQQVEQPTFTYKTVRLNRAPDQRQSHQQHQQQPQLQQSAEQLDSHSAYLSPVSSITKTLAPAHSNNNNNNNNDGIAHIQQSSNNINNNNNPQQLVSSFEFVIGGLERNTEYSILIQCFNRKGAGPTSDPVIFKTFANDPPEKLALNVDEISESSVRVHWRFIHSNEKYQLVDGFVLAFAKLINHNNNNHNNRPHSGPQMAAADGAAELTPQTSSSSSSSSVGRLAGVASADRQQAAARIAQPTATTRGFANFSGQAIDQWQAIQLSPQQRSHQLKNLECGTSYAMKIWAFNKIGKGEPSELVTVSTRGKAPIAPDRRSFLSVNSTQVRLHLSAWYDGGCEIDKFIVQYRAWGGGGGGQHADWILVSDNILREQLSVVIRDLSPATSYELSVGAQSQVGLTEVKYRFITLDREGKPVSPPANLFASSATDDSAVDYPTTAEADGTTRRDFWPAPGESGASMARSLLVLRHFLNSPLALVLSLCFFVVLLMVLIFYKFNGDSQPASSSSSSNRSARSISTLNLNSSNKSSGGRTTSSSGEPNTNMMNDCELIGGGGGSGGSGCTDSPARLSSTYHQPSIRLINNSDNNNYSLAPSEPACHYQSFCGAAQPAMMRQPDLSEYSHYGLPSAAAAATNYEPTATAHGYAGLAAAHRSATMDQLNQQQQQQQPAGSSIQLVQVDHPDRNRQLMQMFMLGQNQPHLDPIPEMANGLHHQKTLQQANVGGGGGGGSYVTAALATMARGARNSSGGAMKPFGDQHHHQHLFQAGTLGRQLHSTSNNNNNCGDIGFLGKPVVVHSACDGDGAGQSSTTLQPLLSCQQTASTMNNNNSIDNNWATNNHRISMTTTDEQTSGPIVVGMAPPPPPPPADDRRPELYPLTTFRHPASGGIQQAPTLTTFDVSCMAAIGAHQQQQQPAPLPPPQPAGEQYNSDGSAASSSGSSGRGTATTTSASQDGPANFKRPTMAATAAAAATTETCGSSQLIECPSVGGKCGGPSTLMEQQSSICDERSSNSSPYDVPFKFSIKQQNGADTAGSIGLGMAQDSSQQLAELAKTICY